MRLFLNAGLVGLTLLLPVSPRSSLLLADQVVQAQTAENTATADRLFEQGTKQVRQNQIQAAITSFQQALTLYREQRQRAKVGQTLKSLGNAYFVLKDYARAIVYQQQALVLGHELNDRDLEGRALNNLGSAYKELGNSKKAVPFYQQALSVAKESQDLALAKIVLRNLNKVFSQKADPIKLIGFYEQFAEIARGGKDQRLRAITLYSIGRDYENNFKDYRRAISYYQEALQIVEQRQEPALQVEALLAIAYASSQTTDRPIAYHRARELAQRGFNLAQALNNRSQQARALAVIADLYSAAKDYPRAITAYQQAIATAQQANDKFREARVLRALGSLYGYHLNDYPHAIQSYQQALAVAQTNRDWSGEMLALAELSNIYFLTGDYANSIEAAEQVRALGQKLKNPGVEAMGLLLLTAAYYGQGSPRVEEVAHQSLRLAEKAKNSALETIATAYLGWWYSDVGEYAKAYDFTQRSLKLAREPQNRGYEEITLYVLGNIHRKQRQFQQAIAAYEKVVAISDSVYGYRALVGLAQVYQAMNKPASAIAYYKQAVSRLESIRSHIRNAPPDLQQSFLQAVQGAGRQKTSEIYRQLADVLLAQGRILEAQQVLELLKIEEIRDLTHNTRASSDTPSTIGFSQVEQDVMQKFGSLLAFSETVYQCDRDPTCTNRSELNTKLKALTAQYRAFTDQFEAELAQRRGKDDSFVDPTRLGNAQELLDSQPDPTLLIYPLILDNKVWLVWVARGGAAKSFPVEGVGQKQLAEAVLRYRQLMKGCEQRPCGDRDTAEIKAVSQQLYRWLIAPIEPQLQASKIKNLIFALDRSARYIPMAALYDGKQYLIEKYTVSTIISADLTPIGKPAPFSPQNTQVLALGVSEAKAGFNSLPNVPVELDAIVQQKPDDRQGVYTGQEFLNQFFNQSTLESNLRKYRIIHIATHGKFDPTNPLNSFLLLGAGEKFLVDQIRNLPLMSNVDLVTLSACESALGDTDQDGRELNSMSYYFLERKTKAVMASLWQVNDTSTSLLMQRFYQNLATGTMTKAQALQRVQQDFLQGKLTAKDAPVRSDLVPTSAAGNQPTRSTAADFAHPYYWAPFILIGNGL